MKNITSLSPSGLRRLIQLGFTLYFIYIGYRFFAFLRWAHGTGPEAVRPASVEGFLPISALMGLKRLLMTGEWDPVHPAGAAIFICVLLMAWLFRKGFCGYICPVGFIANLSESLGRKMGLAGSPPRVVDNILCSLKYLGLAFFLSSVLTMPLSGLEQFLKSPYNLTADARMFDFFADPSAKAVVIIGVLLGLGVLIRNFWCRYLCPYGALLGVISFFSPVAVVRDSKSCVQCGKCAEVCPGCINVPAKERVSSPECIGCAACVGTCPVEGCLSVRAVNRRVPYWTIAAGVVVVLLGGWLIASATGHWESTLPANMLRMLYARSG